MVSVFKYENKNDKDKNIPVSEVSYRLQKYFKYKVWLHLFEF